MKSMTGYGEKTVKDKDIECTVQIRSLNHRFLQIDILSHESISLKIEKQIEDIVKEKVERGKILVNLQLNLKGLWQMEPDLELAESYLSALRKLKKSLNIKENVKFSHLLIFPDILKIKKNNSSEKLQNLIIEAVKGALDDLIKSKEKEGQVHLREIKKHLKKIKSSIDHIKKEFPVAQKKYMEKIQEEIKKLPAKENLASFLNSTTSKIPLFLTKGDIEEEIVRFYSHLEEFEKTLKRKTPVGKKLAFILQELAREINTIGAKSLSSTVSQEVVQIKECIEKTREQISNIE